MGGANAPREHFGSPLLTTTLQIFPELFPELLPELFPEHGHIPPRKRLDQQL
ncbi:hypothetical protein AB0D04_14915 [Streptomyces sp. NPDC048483]|uniref:hypothetical protein n=1 Tax=Streptomyces sp. NPDC048483 TaxID=3154927 RepID=UPI00344981D2